MKIKSRKKRKWLLFLQQVIQRIGRGKFFIYIILLVILFFLSSLQPLFLASLFTAGDGKMNFSFFLLLFFSFLATSLVYFPTNYMLQEVRKASKQVIWQDITQKNYQEFVDSQLGELQNLSAEAAYSARSLQYEGLTFLLQVFLLFSFYSFSLFSYDRWSGVLYLLCYLVYFLLSIGLSRNNATFVQEALDTTSATNAFFLDYFRNIETILSFGTKKMENNRYDECLEKERKTYFRLQRRMDIHQLFLQLILSLITIILIVFILYRGTSSVTPYILMIIYSSINMNGFGKQFLAVLESIHRLDISLDKLGFPKSIEKQKEKIDNRNDATLVDLKNISFTYQNKTVLDCFSLQIRQGDHLLIKGKNGSGKSTLLKLIKGLLSPTTGNITYAISLKKIGYYAQRAILFDRSIKENMIYPLSQVDERFLSEVIRDVKLDHLFSPSEDLAKIYPGDYGDKLSGGERQKILLIRSIVNQQVLVLLDEIDAALDAEMQDILPILLEKYFKEQAVVMISHRQMNERFFNKILSL